MKTLKIILIIGFLLLVGGGAAVFVLFIRPMTLPVYHFEQQPSTQMANFSASTLRLGSTLYINDASEFSLEMTEDRAGWMNQIGRTQDGMEIYAILGQDEHNFIMLTTFMFPAMIFRRIDLPPVRPGNTTFRALKLLWNESSDLGSPNYRPRSAENTDLDTVTEVTDCLTIRAGMMKRQGLNPGGNLLLLSKDHPGISYLVYTSIDASGLVFLAERSMPDEWIPAGPKFTYWIQQEMSQ